MSTPDRILKKMLLTEKVTNLTAHLNQYAFAVASSADKGAIARAVEETYKVNVTRVNVINVKPRLKRDRMRRGKMGLKSGYKKALITLKEGEAIETA